MILPHIQKEMQRLEHLDQKYNPKSEIRLSQIGKNTGKILLTLAQLAPEGKIVEIGTSAGYSTLWLASANRKVLTYEESKRKIPLAQETFEHAQLDIELRQEDGIIAVKEIKNIALCFLDARKTRYNEAIQNILPNLVKGGILAIDNTTSHPQELTLPNQITLDIDDGLTLYLVPK